MVGITIWSPIWPNIVTGGRPRWSPWLDHLQAIGLCWTAWTKRQKDEKTKWQKHQKTKTTFRQADSVERLGPCGWEEEAVANSGDWCYSAHHYTSWSQSSIIENTSTSKELFWQIISGRKLGNALFQWTWLWLPSNSGWGGGGRWWRWASEGQHQQFLEVTLINQLVLSYLLQVARSIGSRRMIGSGFKRLRKTLKLADTVLWTKMLSFSPLDTNIISPMAIGARWWSTAMSRVEKT